MVQAQLIQSFSSSQWCPSPLKLQFLSHPLRPKYLLNPLPTLKKHIPFTPNLCISSKQNPLAYNTYSHLVKFQINTFDLDYNYHALGENGYKIKIQEGLARKAEWCWTFSVIWPAFLCWTWITIWHYFIITIDLTVLKCISNTNSFIQTGNYLNVGLFIL